MLYKLSVVFLLGLLCALIIVGEARASDKISDLPFAYEKTESHCKISMRKNPGLIHICISNQLSSLKSLESYIERRERSNPEDIEILTRLLKTSIVESPSKGVDKWADWFMVRVKFKTYMQDWLLATGKTDSNLEYGL